MKDDFINRKYEILTNNLIKSSTTTMVTSSKQHFQRLVKPAKSTAH